jgi:hypothetical protein
MFQNLGGGKKKHAQAEDREAMKLLADEEAGKLVNDEEIKRRALANVEQNGIVFLDEIDKIAARSDAVGGADVSRQGVQRDLLPLVEGTPSAPSTAWSRPTTSCSSPVGRLPPGQAVRPDPRAAGPLADPRRARVAVGGRLRAHPDQTDACLTKQYRRCWPPRA